MAYGGGRREVDLQDLASQFRQCHQQMREQAEEARLSREATEGLKKELADLRFWRAHEVGWGEQGLGRACQNYGDKALQGQW